jgi:hypothetical protein
LETFEDRDNDTVPQVESGDRAIDLSPSSFQEETSFKVKTFITEKIVFLFQEEFVTFTL